jgi:CubicO group peptidase (beta-lactamase class C family)
MNRRRVLCFTQIAILLVAAPATGSTFHEEIELAIRAELEQSGVPSLQVAVGRKGEIVYDGAFGLADLEQYVAASPETRYRSASISKWLTATATMKLVEQGRLDLDQSIHEYCPQFPKKRWRITARHLLTHTSGIRDYADYEAELAQAASDDERADIERRQNRDALGTYTRYTDVIAPLVNFKDDPLVFEPGTAWLYTSFGYRVLACVIEGVAGQTYQSLLDAEVLEPAGMTRTVADDAWTVVPNRAAGYRLIRGDPIRRADMRDVSENLPAGGHLTTATDLIRFAQAFQAGQLVSPESASLMTQGLSSEAVDTDNYASWRYAIPSRDRYGYGIMSFPNEMQLWIGHTGRQAGASSIVVLAPEQGLSIAVLTNVKGWGGYLSLVRKISAIVERDVAVAN